MTGQNTKKIALLWVLRKPKYNIFNQGKAKAPVTIILFDIKEAWQSENGLLKKLVISAGVYSGRQRDLYKMFNFVQGQGRQKF